MAGPFTEAKRAKVIEWLRAGHFRHTAAARARVTSVTITNWCRAGREEVEKAEAEATDAGIEVDPSTLSEKARFYLDCIEAEALAEDERVEMITQSEDTADARWMLERRYAKRWGRAAMHVEHTGPDGGPIQVSVSDARRAFAKKLAAALEREGVALADPQDGADAGPEGGTQGAAEPSA